MKTFLVCQAGVLNPISFPNHAYLVDYSTLGDINNVIGGHELSKGVIKRQSQYVYLPGLFQ